jgi:hypothetical protein
MLGAIQSFNKDKLKSGAEADPPQADEGPAASVPPSSPRSPPAPTGRRTPDRPISVANAGTAASSVSSADDSGEDAMPTGTLAGALQSFSPSTSDSGLPSVVAQAGALAATPVVVMGPAGPVTMLMTAAGLIPMPMLAPVASLNAMAPMASLGSPYHQPMASPAGPNRFAPSGSPSASRGSRGLLAAPGAMTEPALDMAAGDDEEISEGPGDVTDPSAAMSSSRRHVASKSPGPSSDAVRAAEAAESRQQVDKLESVLGLTPSAPAEPAPASTIPSAALPETVGEPAPRRKELAPVHTHVDAPPKKQPDSALRVADVQARGGKPAPESGLGSFMFVKNSRFDATRPSPDNPRFWVGRVAEIMRGGRIRLHWHRETALESGQYVPTNNYFPERQGLLKNFSTAVFDPTGRVWCVHPAVEAEAAEKEREEAAARRANEAAANAAAAGVGVGGPNGDDVAIGSFVFLRNARFRPENETVITPRYWVARVTSINVQDKPGLSASQGAGASVGGVRQMLTTPDGQLRLQWHRETELGSGMYTATNNIFYEAKKLVKPIPGNMRFDSVLNVWRRGADGSPVEPLLFPGDEPSVAKATTAAAATGTAPGATADKTAATPAAPLAGSSRVISTPVPAVPIEVGGFAFVPNSRLPVGAPETVTSNPRFWVARVLGVMPGTPGQPTRVKVQWHQEVAVGSGLYRQVNKTFFETPSMLRPLPGMVYDKAAQAWKLSQPFNDQARFEDPAKAAEPAPHPLQPRAQDGGADGASATAATPAHLPAPHGPATGPQPVISPPSHEAQAAPAQPAPQAQRAPRPAGPSTATPVTKTDGGAPRAVGAVVKAQLAKATGLYLDPARDHTVYAILRMAGAGDASSRTVCTDIATLDGANATFAAGLTEWNIPKGELCEGGES